MYYNTSMSDIPIQKLTPELSVTNLKKSLIFYCDILGAKVLFDRPDEGFAYITIEDSQLMLDEIGKTRTWETGEFSYPLGRGINFQIEIEDMETILNNLEKNNIKLFMEPEEKWYRTGDVESGQRQFLVQDPDGYLLRFAKHLGERPLQLS